MYDDGWNGPFRRKPNLACTSAAAAGCWGHRNNILAEWSRVLLAHSPGMWYLEAGAAQVPTTVAQLFPVSGAATEASDAMIVTATETPPHYVYTWAQAVAAGAEGRQEDGGGSARRTSSARPLLPRRRRGGGCARRRARVGGPGDSG